MHYGHAMEGPGTPTTGHWIEVNSFQFGVGKAQSQSTPTRSAGQPQVSEIKVEKVLTTDHIVEIDKKSVDKLEWGSASEGKSKESLSPHHQKVETKGTSPTTTYSDKKGLGGKAQHTWKEEKKGGTKQLHHPLSKGQVKKGALDRKGHGHGAKTDQGTPTTVHYDLTNVESSQWAGSSGGDDRPGESLSFGFSKVSIEPTTTGETKGTSPVTASWDLATHTKE
jgi:hypothetical protein